MVWKVGVFQGLTLPAVANKSPDLLCYGVDNFAYNPSGVSNHDIVVSRIKKLNLDNVEIINIGFEVAFDNFAAILGSRKIAVYFIDGPHNYRSQLMCLEYALPHLHEDAAIIVGDCNYNHVRQANRDFLHTYSEWKLLFESYTHCYPGHMHGEELAAARPGWWNGVNILVRDKADVLANTEPITIEDKTRFYNDHAIHGSRKVEAAPHAVAAVEYLLGFRLIKAFSNLMTVWLHRGSNAAQPQKRYWHSNTDTAQLPRDQFNSALRENWTVEFAVSR